MRKSVKWLSIAAVGLLVSAGLYLWWSGNDTVAEEIRQTAQVKRTTLEQTAIATGVIRPVVGAEINVGSRISGTVVHLPVAVGDRVEVGQLLAQLDSAALEAGVDQARADLALAQSRLELARSTQIRSQRLIEKGLISEESLETSIRDLAVEEAQLEASRARLRSAETVLGYARITAPIKGVIAEVSTREGETVAAGFASPTFVTIVDLERLEVLAYIDETDIGRIYVGQAASFFVDTYPNVDFVATVTAIQPKAETQGSVVNYVARLDFEPRDGCTLRPEMTTHLRVRIGEREQALTIPREALRHRDGREHVVVERSGEWSEQEVKTGWRTQTSVEILGGLDEGEFVELNPS